MKTNYFTFLGLIFGLFLSSLPHFVLVTSLQLYIGSNNYNITNNGLDEPWSIRLDCIPQDITIDSNNCIYVVGYDISWNRSLKLLKYDNSGAQLWNIHIEDFIIYYPIIKSDSNNNLYLACSYRNQTSESRKTLAKFNSSGDLQWQQIWASENITGISDIAIDSEDNIYIYGSWESEDRTNHTIIIMKFNSSGNQLGYQILEENSIDINARGLEIDSDNNIIVSGSSYDNEWVYWLRSYNISGELQWAIYSKYESFAQLESDSSENLISIVITWDKITYERNIVLMKYDNSGNSVWNYTFESKFTDHFYYGGIRAPMVYLFDLTVDTLDNIYITWNIEIPNDLYTTDILLIKTNKSGNFERYLTWGRPDYDYSMDIDTDSNNNLYLCSDYYLVKNPSSNGKSFYRTNLVNLLLTLFGIFCFISLVSLYFIIKPKIRKISRK